MRKGRSLMHFNREQSCLFFFSFSFFPSPDPVFHFKSALTRWLHYFFNKPRSVFKIHLSECHNQFQRAITSGEKEGPSALVPVSLCRDGGWGAAEGHPAIHRHAGATGVQAPGKQ